MYFEDFFRIPTGWYLKRLLKKTIIGCRKNISTASSVDLGDYRSFYT
jgi:hypothetical protein